MCCAETVPVRDRVSTPHSALASPRIPKCRCVCVRLQSCGHPRPALPALRNNEPTAAPQLPAAACSHVLPAQRCTRWSARPSDSSLHRAGISKIARHVDVGHLAAFYFLALQPHHVGFGWRDSLNRARVVPRVSGETWRFFCQKGDFNIPQYSDVDSIRLSVYVSSGRVILILLFRFKSGSSPLRAMF
jgi:hypothetical protein